MKQDSRIPIPESLQLPLRDLLRGVTSAAELTEDALKPVATLLPGPVQSKFIEALRSVENSIDALGKYKCNHDTVKHASEFIHGTNQQAQAAAKTATVFGLAWDRQKVNETSNSHLMYSEVIAAAHLRKFVDKPNENSHIRPSRILLEMRNSNSVGMLPGLATELDRSAKQTRDAIFSSTVIWLLADRAGSFEEELKLFDMASALLFTLFPNTQEMFADNELLEKELWSISQHL